MSDLGESPTLRDAIAAGIADFFEVGGEDEDAAAEITEAVYDSVKAFFAESSARELVVPSPQPSANSIESASSTYKMVDPYKTPICICRHGRDFHAYPGPASTPCSICPCRTFVDSITGSTSWTVSPLPETEQTC